MIRKNLKNQDLRAKLSKNDTAVINSYIIYRANSPSKTQTPDKVKANPFGLKNMAGNVAEFCSDWYQPDAYSQYPEGIIKDPKGPESGEEHVVRGGSFLDMAGNLRSAARRLYTEQKTGLKRILRYPKASGGIPIALMSDSGLFVNLMKRQENCKFKTS